MKLMRAFRRTMIILGLYRMAILEANYVPRYGMEWMLGAIGLTAFAAGCWAPDSLGLIKSGKNRSNQIQLACGVRPPAGVIRRCKLKNIVLHTSCLDAITAAQRFKNAFVKSPTFQPSRARQFSSAAILLPVAVISRGAAAEENPSDPIPCGYGGAHRGHSGRGYVSLGTVEGKNIVIEWGSGERKFKRQGEFADALDSIGTGGIASTAGKG